MSYRFLQDTKKNVFSDANICLTKYNVLLHSHWQCNPAFLRSKILSLGQMNAFVQGYLLVNWALLLLYGQWKKICRWLCSSEGPVVLTWKKLI